MSAAEPLPGETVAGPVPCTREEYLARERASLEKHES